MLYYCLLSIIIIVYAIFFNMRTLSGSLSFLVLKRALYNEFKSIRVLF